MDTPTILRDKPEVMVSLRQSGTLGEIVIQKVNIFTAKSNLPKRGLERISLNSPQEDLDSYHRLLAYKSNVLKQIQTGNGLYIYGPPGNGKTSWAYKIAQTVIWESAYHGSPVGEIPVYFISVPNLMNDIKKGFNDPAFAQDLDNKLRRAKLLILDDLGAENSTGYAQEQLFSIINYRYSEMLTTVITSNVSLRKIERRIADRLSETSQVIYLQAGSQRANKGDPQNL